MRKPFDRTTDSGARLQRLAMKQIVPLALSIGLFVLLQDKIAGLDFPAIRAGLGRVSPVSWAAAACFSAVSFWAVGRYDRVVHGMTGTGITGAEATRAGATSIAVAQTLGFGVISGALVRWRMLPSLTLLAALRLSLTVAVSFLAGWAVITAGAVLFLRGNLPFPAARTLAGAVLLLAGLFGAASLWRPAFLARICLPSLRAMGLVLMLVLLDTSMAGAALYLLLPAGSEVDLAPFLAAFLVALGAGLVMGTPGGVGPFEVMLISLLPALDQHALLSAILAFRLVYYALPAMLAAVEVIRGPKPQSTDIKPVITPAPTGDGLKTLLSRADDPEFGLLRLGRLSLLDGQAMVAPLGQSLVMLRGAMSAPSAPQDLLARLDGAARARFLGPCLYKAPPRLAVAARRAGWQVVPIARDAWIDPQAWKPEGRPFRQLRRKLRKAEKAGVTIQRGHSLPLAEMARINSEWAARRGGERGFSMGVFAPATLDQSVVWLAYRNDRLIGFLSLLQTGNRQVLDLMRYANDAPDGVMHLALSRAIEDARAQGLDRLSLAAVPFAGKAAEHTCLRNFLDRTSGASGLAQFKRSFAANWAPLYLAAPNRIALAVAALEIGREITRKPVRNRGQAQVQHAGFEFAPDANPWQQAGE